ESTQTAYMDAAFPQANPKGVTTGFELEVTEPGGTTGDAVNDGQRRPASATATVDFEVRGLVFLGMAAYFDASYTTLEGSTSATANLCMPGENPYTVGGTCVRTTD